MSGRKEGLFVDDAIEDGYAGPLLFDIVDPDEVPEGNVGTSFRVTTYLSYPTS